jgi:lipoprotein-anchoring transpeptidase ErfK/SrfK
MSSQLTEARLAVQKAREALRNNDRGQARQWAEQAARLAPKLEDPWLILAAVASPRASLEYIRTALQINPNSPRARRGMQWAMERLREPEAPLAETRKALPVTAGRPAVAAQPVTRPPAKRSLVFPVMLLGLGCLVCAGAAWSAFQMPAVAAMIRLSPLVAATPRPPSWAQVFIPRPTEAAIAQSPQSPVGQLLEAAATPTPQIASTPAATESPSEPTLSPDLSTALPTQQPTEMAAELPTEMPTEAATEPPTAEPTWAGSLTMEYVQDTPTSERPTPAPAATPAPPGGVASGVHWIDVNLTQQMVYAYAGDSIANSFLVSTGTWLHPTVTGSYHVYVKLRYTDMSGPDYYLPNVPYTMYFFQGYGLHGTYWHHNFGTPMSHGCVNLSIPDAAWLYNFASVGTLVKVHY